MNTMMKQAFWCSALVCGWFSGFNAAAQDGAPTGPRPPQTTTPGVEGGSTDGGAPVVGGGVEQGTGNGPATADAPAAPGRPELEGLARATDTGRGPAEDVPSNNPALETADRLQQRIRNARGRIAEITVDLTVLSENGSLEAQLKEGRLAAEQKRLEEEVVDLEKSAASALAAAECLVTLSDQEHVDRVFSSLASRTEVARSAVDGYRRERAQRIALAEASAPVPLERTSPETDVSMRIDSILEGGDPKRRADFLALVYAVANELGIEVRSTDARGREVWNRYATLLERPPRAEKQMVMVTLIAYQNRQNQRSEGTLLGLPLTELASSGAVNAAGGRRYAITPAASEAYLMKPLRAVWDAIDIRVGQWDLSKSGRTTVALRKFSSGEFDAPDGQLLVTLTEIRERIEAESVADALTSEVERNHRESVSAAKKHNLEMEKKASDVFQAERLLGSQSQRMKAVSDGVSFFAEEAARLQDPGRGPRFEPIQRHSRAIREAAIGLGRAEHIADVLSAR